MIAGPRIASCREIACDQVHHGESHLFARAAGDFDALLTVQQVLGKLKIKSKLRADEQDEPAQIYPDQRGQHDGEARVDGHQLRGVEDQRREGPAHQRPDDAGRRPADECRPKIHAGIRHEQVHEGEHCRDQHVRHAAAEQFQAGRERGHGMQPMRERTVRHRNQQADGDAEDDRTGDHHTQVLAEPAHETSRAFDPPDEVEAGLHFLDRRDHGIDQEDEPQGAEHVAAHVRDELHDVVGEFGGGVAQRQEKLMQDVTQMGAGAQTLQDGKTEHQQGYERQEGGVGETHRADVDVAGEPVAGDGGRITQQPQDRSPRRRHGARFEEQAVFQAFEQRGHATSLTWRSGRGKDRPRAAAHAPGWRYVVSSRSASR